MKPGVIRDVADTAAWVAYFRALESERPDALFRDPHARQLAGERGRAIAESLSKGPLRWSLAVRTRVFDELIVQTVRGKEPWTVVNLAAGFDTRPYRLGLPPHVRWIEADLPRVIEQKRAVLVDARPTCSLERFAVDLADDGARRDFWTNVEGERTLVIAEGLLAYLEESNVAALAQEIRHLPGSLWLIENVAPDVLAKLQRRWGQPLRSGNAQMKFAPADELEFFHRYGWVPRDTRGLLDEAERLGREMPIVTAIRRLSSLIPPIKGAYAKRQARLHNAVVYAIMEHDES
jgi:methyltransferase (TIGR00027 family)